MAAGKLSVAVAATYPLSDVVESQKAILTGHTSGKIILVPYAASSDGLSRVVLVRTVTAYAQHSYG